MPAVSLSGTDGIEEIVLGKNPPWVVFNQSPCFAVLSTSTTTPRWGVVAVSLIGLWVRSYWWQDSLYVNYAGRNSYNYSETKTVGLISVQGRIVVSNRPMRWDPWIQLRHSKVLFPQVYHDDRGLKSTSAWFRVMRYSSSTEVLIPYWFTALVLAAPATVIPWLQWKCQFSLRTLLITTPLFALALGTIVWLAHR
jgi:hypothetical protein